MNTIYSVGKTPLTLWARAPSPAMEFCPKKQCFYDEWSIPWYYISLGSIRPPTQGIPSLLSQGRNRPPVCHRAPWEAHSFAHWGRFLSRRRRRRRKRKWIRTQRKVMDTGKLRSQVLPLFLVFTLLTREIHGFTLPQASKENKESLTEAMVIHFVTCVLYDRCRQCENIDRLGLFSFLCRQQSSAASPEKID